MALEELTMDYRVDNILNNWFGEPPEHSNDERNRVRHLYAPLRKLEDELLRLRAQLTEQSGAQSLDCMGGQFTQEQIDNSNAWR
jgi:hypothetical protein